MAAYTLNVTTASYTSTFHFTKLLETTMTFFKQVMRLRQCRTVKTYVPNGAVTF